MNQEREATIQRIAELSGKLHTAGITADEEERLQTKLNQARALLKHDDDKRVQSCMTKIREILAPERKRSR